MTATLPARAVLLSLSAADIPDRELLDRFGRRRDEDAFAALVRRHGPLVMGVCRRVLPSWHDAEDAFQATFLTLARKADAAGRRGSLAGWLARVAYRTARAAQERAAKRRRREESIIPPENPDLLAEVTGRELLSALDAELQRLPERYRLPILLCALDGHTSDEAARRLGWSVRTVKRRLQQGRAALGARLTRRGLSLPAGLLTLGAAARSVGPALARSTTALATGRTAAPEAVVTLAEAASRRTISALVKVAAALLLVFAAAAGVLGQRDAPTPAAPPAPPADAAPTTTLAGLVLDPDGRPVGDAAVLCLAWRKADPEENDNEDRQKVIGRARTDADGRFHLTLPRPMSQRVYSVKVAAVKTGFGPQWQGVDPDAARVETTLRLPRERVVRGRLLGLQGEPAARATIRLSSLDHKDGRRQHLGVPDGLIAPATTGADGRFVLRGVGAGQEATLQVRDPRFARTTFTIADDHKERDGEIGLTAAPARALSGRVTFADTGRPAAHARLLVMAVGGNVTARADADGRYALSLGDSPSLTVYTSPAPGEPYSVLKVSSAWPKSAARHTVDVALRRGVVVSGTVVDDAGRPVAGARVQFFPQMTGNDAYQADVACLYRAAAWSGGDGSFRLVLPPGPAHLLVDGPTDEFVHRETLFGVLAHGSPSYGTYHNGPESNAYFGGHRVYAHAVVPVKVEKGKAPPPVRATLTRGATVRGRVLGVDGKPPAHLQMVSRLNVSEWENIVGGWTSVFAGRFELRGCDPSATYRVFFFDPEKEEGAVVEVSGKATAPVEVRLQRCGKATARLVGGDGKPLAKVGVKFDLVVTPGAAEWGADGPLADLAWQTNFDPTRYRHGPRSDDQGRLTLPALIPGVKYRLSGQGIPDLEAKAGATVDWGTLKGVVTTRD